MRTVCAVLVLWNLLSAAPAPGRVARPSGRAAAPRPAAAEALDPATHHEQADGLAARAREQADPAARKALIDQALGHFRAAAVAADYSKLDRALLGLGDAASEAGLGEEALAAWRRLVREFPESKAAPDAWLSIGAALQDEASSPDAMGEACDALSKAVAGRVESMAMARYRLGQCQVALGELEPGLEELGKAVALAPLVDEQTASQMRLTYVETYGRAGDPRRALAELRKIGGDEHSWDMLKDLGALYHDTGRIADSARLFRQLLQDRPLSPDAPLFRYHLVGYLLRDAGKAAIVAEVKELAKVIQAIRREGHFGRPEDQRSFAAAQGKTDAMLASLATTWHEEAQASGDAAAVTIAAELCNLYLLLFPDAVAAEIRKCSQGF